MILIFMYKGHSNKRNTNTNKLSQLRWLLTIGTEEKEKQKQIAQSCLVVGCNDTSTAALLKTKTRAFMIYRQQTVQCYLNTEF